MNDEFRLRWTAVVRRDPNQTALVDGNRVVSYEALFRRATQYAKALINRRVYQTCIPVFLTDPVEHVVALLGVLLSGNYYHSVRLPVGELPDLLPEGAVVISDFSIRFSEQSRRITLTPAALEPVDRDTDLCPVVRPTDAFCLFTTSGSTGAPKQVIHSHQSVLTDTLRQIADNHISHTDRIDLLFSLEFSASLACLFPALLTGATVVFHDLKTAGVLSLPTFWQQQHISFSSLSVSTFRALLKTGPDLKNLTGLRMLSIGAEPVRPDDITGFQDRFPANTVLQVAYATTETRTISEHKIRVDTPVSDALFSVGKPVVGRAVSIRSETGEQLPPKHMGEIVVTARHIPSAYPNRPDATQRAYWVDADGWVQYATGDLGFLDDNGYLFWCGRTDFVVKINGQKVSLIQVEQELKGEPGVLNAAVVYDTRSADRPLLKAFLCVEPGFDESRLRRSLAQRLPALMCPDRYVLLDALPLTKTGKVDRTRLATWPEIEARQPVRIVENERPDLVFLIQSIWRQELGLKQEVSAYDDFFQDLGGDSLTAESCLAHLENRLCKTFPVQVAFSYTSPKALAQYVAGHGQQPVQCIPLNEPEPHRPSVYFIPPLPGDRRMYRWIESSLNRLSNLYFVHYEPYTAEGELIPFLTLIQEIAQVVAESADRVLIGFSFGGLVAYRVALALEQAGKPALRRLVLLDTPLYRRVTFGESLRKDAGRIGRKVLAGLQADPSVHWRASWQRAVNRYQKRFVAKPDIPVGTTSSANWQEACFSAVGQYVRAIRVETPVSCPILLFRASDSSAFQYEIRPDFGWKPYTNAQFEEHVLDANHDQVLNSVNSYVIGAAVSEFLIPRNSPV
ncbi:AMP-binding protein [Larkinella sp. VNQ87]|uniref:AMP-binding protein n=1 Tax=Larkinella sp. VNQ87 TaxID=3400921 RepID=UPI003BFFDFA1